MTEKPARRGNPYPHRYKYGLLKKPIDLDLFERFLERAKRVDRCGYSIGFIQALHALFYWTGLRKTEVLGRKAVQYKVDHKDCRGKGCPNCNGAGKVWKVGKPHPGLLKEDLKLEDEYLLIFSVGERVLKHGKREAPIWLHKSLPYVNLIIERWKKTKPGHRVFPITGVTFWRICKRMDPKFTMHFYRHNRITLLAADEEMSLADIVAHTGLTPRTVAEYMMREGRFTRKVGERMKEKFGRKS